jgi:hypothetical protein
MTRAPRHTVKYRDPGGVWIRRERAWNETRNERRRRVLAGLRAAFPEGEQPLVGWPAICAWLNAHQFRSRTGNLVTEHVAKGWQHRLQMPVLRGRPGRPGRWRCSLPWSSSFLLLSWAVSLYLSGGPDAPRVVADCDADFEAASDEKQ